MSDFILEIYGEEIPSSAQSLIENQFKKLFSQLFEDNEIKYKDLQTFYVFLYKKILFEMDFSNVFLNLLILWKPFLTYHLILLYQEYLHAIEVLIHMYSHWPTLWS